MIIVGRYHDIWHNLMIYVGIDIAKLNHFASAIPSDGEELRKPFKFTNDGDGFHFLHFRLDKLSRSSDSIIIGLESTAHYGNNLVSCNYNVYVLNPIKTITDKVNAFSIAKTLMMQESLRSVFFYNLDLTDLKAPKHYHMDISDKNR